MSVKRGQENFQSLARERTLRAREKDKFMVAAARLLWFAFSPVKIAQATDSRRVALQPE
jgi:hypothetical protein